VFVIEEKYFFAARKTKKAKGEKSFDFVILTFA